MSSPSASFLVEEASSLPATPAASPAARAVAAAPAKPFTLTDPPAAAPRRRWFRPSRLGLFLAGAVLIVLVVAAVFPGLLASGNPLEANAREAFRAPSLAHPFGTDENGRDVLTRIVHGARPSLVMGLASTVIGVGLGALLGLVAGLSHRRVDGLLMRFIDMLLAFPDLLLALVIITFWGQGMTNAIIAIGVASVPRYARLVRAQAHVVRRASYVEAALSLGLHPLTVIWRHVLPNAIKPILLLATIGIGGKIAAGASLSFLGLGSPPPSPEWGSMLAVGRNFLSNAWWLTAAPGVTVVITVVSVTALGRALMRRSEGKPV